MTLSDVRRFPATVWIILLGTFLTRASFFMVWPFMAVILFQKFGMPQSHIGAILSLTALAGAIFSLYVGYVSDKLGRKGVIVVACMIYVGAFILLAMANVAWLFAIGAVLVGLSRSMLEPPSRALISDLIDDKKLRELAHHVRYYMVNVGAAFGPIVGLKLGFTGAQHTFWLVALAYGLWGAGFVWAFRRIRANDDAEKSPYNFKETLNVLRKDHAFLLLILANALVMYSYMHQETSLVQHLNQLGERVIQIYTPIMLINASIIVLLQFPLLKLLSNRSLLFRVYIGVAGFAVAFIMYGFIPLDGPIYWWYVATVVLSLGEVILFPSFSLLIDRIAPENMRGTYFGASGLGAIGVSLSPFIGGIVLQYAGGAVLFFSTSVVLGVAAWLYYRSDRELAERTANSSASNP
jgi:MFS family permease